jgi:hypothetical protein
MPKVWTVQRTLGVMYCGRVLCLIGLAGLAVAAAFAPPEALAQTVDPQSLVGAWVGNWSFVSHGNTPGDYTMTVTKVEGNQVFGRIERGTGAYTSRMATYDFVGTLEDNKLVFGGSLSSGEVTIDGTQMRGTALENTRMNISMTKSK